MKTDWWQKPGLGIMYQIEHREGWKWNRNFNKFNSSMMEDGKLKFNGPYCRISEWIKLSKRVGVDYHIFEVKWHDGIVWFDSSLTEWKAPFDYAGEFARESRNAGIPFLFYYSSAVDHNPQFSHLIPFNFITPSFPKMGKSDTYRNYLLGQMKEIMDKYAPDGLWFDWYLAGLHPSEIVVAEFLRDYSPHIIFTFNHTNAFRTGFLHAFCSLPGLIILGFFHYLLFEKERRKALDLVTYTTFEAHTLKSAWNRSKKYRKFKYWELVGPAGKAWDKVELRNDLYELLRIASIVMASGGRYVVGVASKLDGEIYPEHVRQVELLGEWYRERKEFFREGVPVERKGIPGKNVLCSRYGEDCLIHIFGREARLNVGFKNKYWRIREIYLEPGREKLEPVYKRDWVEVKVEKPDPVDTILRVVED